MACCHVHVVSCLCPCPCRCPCVLAWHDVGYMKCKSVADNCSNKQPGIRPNWYVYICFLLPKSTVEQFFCKALHLRWSDIPCIKFSVLWHIFMLRIMSQLCNQMPCAFITAAAFCPSVNSVLFYLHSEFPCLLPWQQPSYKFPRQHQDLMKTASVSAITFFTSMNILIQ